MSAYKVCEAIHSINNVKTGDLLTLTLPDGNTIRGFVTALISYDLDSTLINVYFEDGRSYLVASDAKWGNCCQFNSAWRFTDPNEEEQQ